jgi:hypothetical protein
MYIYMYITCMCVFLCVCAQHRRVEVEEDTYHPSRSVIPTQESPCASSIGEGGGASASSLNEASGGGGGGFNPTPGNSFSLIVSLSEGGEKLGK